MTSPDSITQIAALGIEPTYSAREAAALLGRSYSWLDQRVHNDEFVLPDGTLVRPLQTPRDDALHDARAQENVGTGSEPTDRKA